MSLVEKEITLKNIEQARINPELEKRTETEHKLVPVDASNLVKLFKDEAFPVEQRYLSSPHDEFSLRLRCEYTPEGPYYTSTLKDRGELQDGALKRNEITTEITREAYEAYSSFNTPLLRKLRAQPMDGVTVDFYEDKNLPVLVEVEHNDPEVRAQLLEQMELLANSPLIDRSSDPEMTNEALAYASSEHTPLPLESLDSFTHRVLGEMIARYVSGQKQVVVGLTGMSGSGKTTVTRALQEQMTDMFGEAYTPIVLSTDDYHYGKAALEATYGAPYTEWDSAKTYNTAELAFDIAQAAEGKPILRRHFDFDTEEPVVDSEVLASPFILIEGLYAGSNDLKDIRSLHFELPTSIATSIGRDVRRLVIESRKNRVFPTPESRLRYQVESALPLYLGLERPPKNSFSASTRPLAQRAFMLERYAKL